MSNLTNNTTALQELLNVVNNLPEVGSGANFETSIITISAPVLCKYLGTDLQPKEETTSTFETIKNSFAFIDGIHNGNSSGYNLIMAASGYGLPGIVVQPTESAVNVILGTGGSDD